MFDHMHKDGLHLLDFTGVTFSHFVLIPCWNEVYKIKKHLLGNEKKCMCEKISDCITATTTTLEVVVLLLENGVWRAVGMQLYDLNQQHAVFMVRALNYVRQVMGF